MTNMFTSESEPPGSEFPVNQRTTPMPRIPGRHSAARNRRDRARRRRRPSRFSVLFSFEPDPDNLFLRPGDVAGPPRGPARLWGGRRFRGRGSRVGP